MAREADDGTPLAAAWRLGPFPLYVVGLVEWESARADEEALNALSGYYEGRDRLDRQVRSSLLYPAVLLMVMLVVIVVLLAKVLRCLTRSTPPWAAR